MVVEIGLRRLMKLTEDVAGGEIVFLGPFAVIYA